MNTRKKHLVSGGLLLLYSVVLPLAYGQRTPFAGANTIFISTHLADRQTYEAIGQVLTEQGIQFSAASDGLLISAQGKPFGPYKDATFLGQITVTGSLVKLTGRMQAPPTGDGTMTEASVLPVAFQPGKRKETLPQRGFTFLNDLAKKLQPVLRGVISYKVQP